MNKPLLKLQADELLRKFGAGNHKPGSGSAAAYEGLLAARLVRTVISLTVEPKRSTEYKGHLSELRRIDKEIESQVYPALENLMQEDSNQFDRVIVLRKSRIAETDPTRKNDKRIESLEALKVATELPIEIARHCLVLAEFASFVFDNGFRSARGDSGVALTGALAAAAGCLSIIDLNFTSFSASNWTDARRLEVEQIRDRYRALVEAANVQSEALRNESIRKFQLDTLLKEISQRAQAMVNLSNRDIEGFAQEVHHALWRFQNTVWKKHVPGDPIDMLSPKDAISALGFRFSRQTSLGQYRLHGETVEVAGLIDRSTNRVEVSEQFPLETQNFTAAHELGHAVMHSQTMLHRDKALDGSQVHSSRDPIEFQADKFAACFLMPRKLVTQVFTGLFGAGKFVLNEASAFALAGTDGMTLLSDGGSVRQIARLLAEAESFDGRFFVSMSKRFSVSNKAMAIRLEELELIAI